VADITPPHESPPIAIAILVPRSMIASTLDFNAGDAERLADLLGYPIPDCRERRKGSKAARFELPWHLYRCA